jgi:hypothetical protein
MIQTVMSDAGMPMPPAMMLMLSYAPWVDGYPFKASTSTSFISSWAEHGMGKVSNVFRVSRVAPCTISVTRRVNDPADSVKIPFDTIANKERRCFTVWRRKPSSP